MSIEVMSEFIRTATVRTRAYVYDDDDALANPSSAFIQILNPDGATVVSGTTTMSTASTGILEHYYTLPSTATQGWYGGQVTIVDGSGATAKYSLGTVSFKAK